MLGDLFQVVVAAIKACDTQIIHRDEYLERKKRKAEEYKKMDDYEKHKETVRNIGKSLGL